MKVAVFGLGNFGKHLGIKLTQMGHEVIAIDHDMEKVDAIKQEVSYAVCLESNDPLAMSALPLNDVDAAVVAIGENEGANIMTTALLVNLKVKRVISRAINPLHEMVLNSMGVTDIVAKTHGSSNPYNMVRATLDALRRSTTAAEVAAKRGKSVEELFN